MNSMEHVYVVVRKGPRESFRLFLDPREAREFAQANGFELRGFTVYETTTGDLAVSNMLPMTRDQIARMDTWVALEDGQ